MNLFIGKRIVPSLNERAAGRFFHLYGFSQNQVRGNGCHAVDGLSVEQFYEAVDGEFTELI